MRNKQKQMQDENNSPISEVTMPSPFIYSNNSNNNKTELVKINDKDKDTFIFNVKTDFLVDFNNRPANSLDKDQLIESDKK